jgi:hypothetical protein
MSPAGIAIANQNKSLAHDFRRALLDFSPKDNVGSAYCIRHYVVNKHLGCPEGLDVSCVWRLDGIPSVDSYELHFDNGDAHLVGTVYLLKAGDHLAGVVVLHHATAATREAALYQHLREGLPALGFAVLVFDRRGSGQSAGDFACADFETLADDAIAGQRGSYTAAVSATTRISRPMPIYGNPPANKNAASSSHIVRVSESDNLVCRMTGRALGRDPWSRSSKICATRSECCSKAPGLRLLGC